MIGRPSAPIVIELYWPRNSPATASTVFFVAGVWQATSLQCATLSVPVS
jgi:hypothetical protein